MAKVVVTEPGARVSFKFGVKSGLEFEKLIERHENMISKIINIDPIQKSTFSDYSKGIIKSLGSWGGDFILVSGEKEDLNYFRDKGYNTIYDLEDLVYLN